MSITDNQLKSIVELAYWNVRAVLECAANGGLESPHPLWGYLDELRDDVARMENLLNIANRMENNVNPQP